MRIRRLMLSALCASVAIATAAPAFADDDWRWHRHERQEWREHQWREHEWREHEWRERHAWEHRYPPPYGYGAAPPAYYAGPGYYR